MRLHVEKQRNKNRRTTYERKCVAKNSYRANADSSPVAQDECDNTGNLSFAQVAAQSKQEERDPDPKASLPKGAS